MCGKLNIYYQLQDYLTSLVSLKIRDEKVRSLPIIHQLSTYFDDLIS